MLISITICAHPTRETQAGKLAAELGATICMDDDSYGQGVNHDRALILANNMEDADWAIVVEDDAIPVDTFTTQIQSALANCPTNVASLYLGRHYPRRHQPRIPTLLQSDPHWIVHDELRHGVCVAIRPRLITPLLTIVENIHDLPADYRWGYGLRQLGQPIAYSNPSLVDHDDSQPVITHNPNGTPRVRTNSRTAWNPGARETWDTSYLTL